MNIEEKREDYNRYENFPKLAYNIIKKLFTSKDAEIIWKLLDYKSADDWNKSNLTLKEKQNLIFKGTGNELDYRVFLDFGLEDGQDEEACFLRIYPGAIFPESRVTGVVGVNFEVFCHSKINHLSNYQTRIDTIIQALIDTLNGEFVGGVGRLFFDSDGSSFDSVKTMAQKPYKGKILIMSTRIA